MTAGSMALPPRFDPAHGFEEVIDLEHAVLEQVAEAVRPVFEEVERMGGLHHL